MFNYCKIQLHLNLFSCSWISFWKTKRWHKTANTSKLVVFETKSLKTQFSYKSKFEVMMFSGTALRPLDRSTYIHKFMFHDISAMEYSGNDHFETFCRITVQVTRFFDSYCPVTIVQFKVRWWLWELYQSTKRKSQKLLKPSIYAEHKNCKEFKKIFNEL